MVRISSLTVINHLECKGQAEGQSQGQRTNIQNHLFSIQKVAPEELINIFFKLILVFILKELKSKSNFKGVLKKRKMRPL